MPFDPRDRAANTYYHTVFCHFIQGTGHRKKTLNTRTLNKFQNRGPGQPNDRPTKELSNSNHQNTGTGHERPLNLKTQEPDTEPMAKHKPGHSA